MDNPFAGVAFHAAGGVAHGSFYVPLKKVRGWAWESAWLAQGLAAWMLTPWTVALLTSARPLSALAAVPAKVIWLTYLFGAMWGAGSLTFGLSVRYLGMSLGMAVALGYTVSLGTLVPPIFTGQLDTVFGASGGRVILLGVLVCLVGIGLCGLAGMRRERERRDSSRPGSRSRLVLGFAVASFSGIMSSGFAFGIQMGQPIALAALENGAPEIFKNSAVFIVVMAGGFTVNVLWCLYLALRNRSLGDYLGKVQPARSEWTGRTKPEVEVSSGVLAANYLWAFASGVTWYVGFMLYGVGTTFMGRYDFTSWSVHLAFVIVFSTACGILAGEWKGVRRRTAVWIGVAMAVLVLSTLVIALGNRIAAARP